MYHSVLAEIHDRWFDSIAKAAARHLRNLFSRQDSIALLDLGCGGGILLNETSSMCQNQYGIDISEEMISIAQKRNPKAKLLCSEVLSFDPPQVDAVTMVGEILSYAVAGRSDVTTILAPFFQKIANALSKDGVLLFDVLGADHDYRGSFFHDHEQWTVYSEVTQEGSTVTRRIVSFLKRGDRYEKSIEVHRLHVFSADFLTTFLNDAGFDVQSVFAYDDMQVLPGRLAFQCRKRD